MIKTIAQRGKRKEFDVIIIGSGIAGLCCALDIAKNRKNVHIALVSKSVLQDSNTYYAQGGIAAAKEPASIAKHVSDTLSAGAGLCDQETVQAMLEHGYDCIQYLAEKGVPFDRDEKNKLACGHEAGHSERRIYHVGDHTGKAITLALLNQIKLTPQIAIFENHTAINLITQNHSLKPGQFPEVLGAYVLEEANGLIHTFQANAIVLATGGAGKVYRYTTNPNTATGDGVAMAYRAGARVSGLEFYQFHPTLFYHPKINNLLISEALRGEGAYLRSPATGERFMKRYAPKQMELATRDVVSRAIFCEIENGVHDYVYLDITHQSSEFLKKRFPMISQTLAEVGIDISRDMIPVVPAAHYMGGGILSNIHGETDLKRLYAIGETAFTGLHGANRLASNSLLEGVVMGRNAARALAPLLDTPCERHSISDWDSTSVVDSRRASQINVHWRGLRGEMSSYAGIVRTEAGLRDQLKLVLARREMIEDYYWKYTITRDLIELRNILTIAELIVRAAINRRESRGGHFREDFTNQSIDSFETFNNLTEMNRTSYEAD